MPLFTKSELEDAVNLVHQHMPPTPEYRWPLLEERAGAKLWVKHENHTPTGAFKVRGGITFAHYLQRAHPNTQGIITATRGNHGQSQARAATAIGIACTVVVPYGNSKEKNSAMRAFGATVIEHGNDFDEARLHAMALSEQQQLTMVPPFHPQLVRGVATYAMELFNTVKHLHTVYVPIGCGSGICGLISARDALGLTTEIVGVVSTEATAALDSVKAGKLVETKTANTFADGMAVRVPVQAAFDIYATGAARIVSVSDDEIANAIRAYYTDTHNIAEGAGAAPLAAMLQERDAMAGKECAVILCGGNIDTDLYQTVMAGNTPDVA